MGRKELSCPKCGECIARWESDSGFLFLGFKQFGLQKCRHCNNALNKRNYRIWKSSIIGDNDGKI